MCPFAWLELILLSPSFFCQTWTEPKTWKRTAARGGEEEIEILNSQTRLIEMYKVEGGRGGSGRVNGRSSEWDPKEAVEIIDRKTSAHKSSRPVGQLTGCAPLCCFAFFSSLWAHYFHVNGNRNLKMQTAICSRALKYNLKRVMQSSRMKLEPTSRKLSWLNQK